MIRLLDKCIRILASQGKRKLFIDAVKGGDEGFQSMGKHDGTRNGTREALLTKPHPPRLPEMG
jgi:hypothetical protein